MIKECNILVKIYNCSMGGDSIYLTTDAKVHYSHISASNHQDDLDYQEEVLDKRCDSVRGILSAFESNIYTYDGVKVHLERLGEEIPDILKDRDGGHIPKWNQAEILYTIMNKVQND